MQKLNWKRASGLFLLLLSIGCESLRENVNFQMNAEEQKLEPHEQRREELRDMAQPR